MTDDNEALPDAELLLSGMTRSIFASVTTVLELGRSKMIADAEHIAVLEAELADAKADADGERDASRTYQKSRDASDARAARLLAQLAEANKLIDATIVAASTSYRDEEDFYNALVATSDRLASYRNGLREHSRKMTDDALENTPMAEWIEVDGEHETYAFYIFDREVIIQSLGENIGATLQMDQAVALRNLLDRYIRVTGISGVGRG